MDKKGDGQVLIDYEKIPIAFHLLVSVCYIAVGILLVTDLFHVIDRGKSILFGVFVIGYGLFRAYKACVNMWRRP